MTVPSPGPVPRSWHRALAYAITGQLLDGLGDQAAPDVDALAAYLRRTIGAEELMDHAREAAEHGHPWPHPLPSEEMVGLGYAQFASALTRLQLALDLGPARATVRRVGSDEPLSAEVRRLLEDVPPHHGS